MAGGPSYLYAVVYKEGILRKLPFLYITDNQTQALNYSINEFPGSVVVKLEIVPVPEPPAL